MSGHSKWSTIKRKKGAADAKRGKVFSKLSKELTVAAKAGGENPDMNPRLRLAMDRAKAANMPSENMNRAIKKGSEDTSGANYEETIYEGYGTAGVALMVEVLTDNKNRTVGEVRHMMTKFGGNMGESGCVGWMFDKKGFMLVDKAAGDEDTVMSVALDAGADDFKNEPDEDNYEITSAPEDLHKVKEYIEKENIPINLAEITFIPQNYVKLDAKEAGTMMKLMSGLEDLDDVQNVYANFDIDDDIMATLE